LTATSPKSQQGQDAEGIMQQIGPPAAHLKSLKDRV
jgi:hypothetical protein